MNPNLEEYYLPEKLTKFNFNVYTTRVEIADFIRKKTSCFTGRVLDLGCGNKPYEQLIKTNKAVSAYIGMDLEDSAIYKNVKKDLNWNGSEIPLEDASVQTVLATELLEHCYDTRKILDEIYRVLSANGMLVGTVPFIWPMHETPHDFHRFTPFSLKKKLEESGFREIVLVPFGGHDKMLAVSLAIWLTNHKGGRMKKRILRFFILPWIKKLIRRDKPNTDLAAENNIFIGLGFTAKK